jgi:hypothetical protein
VLRGWCSLLTSLQEALETAPEQVFTTDERSRIRSELSVTQLHFNRTKSELEKKQTLNDTSLQSVRQLIATRQTVVDEVYKKQPAYEHHLDLMEIFRDKQEQLTSELLRLQ